MIRAVPRTRIPNYLIYYAFVFSIPFEMVNIGSGTYTISRMVGYLLVLHALVRPKAYFLSFPAAFMCFGMYLCVYTALAFDQPAEYIPAIGINAFTVIQLMVLSLMSYNLMRSERVMRRSLWILASACTILAVLQALGITTSEDSDPDRVSAFGESANTLAAVLLMGLLSLTGLALGGQSSSKISRWSYILWGLLLVAEIVRTGSRGGMVALAIGLGVLVLGKSRFKASRWKICLAVVALVGCGVLFVLRSETSLLRWERTLMEGDTAGRDLIYEQSLLMISENPVFGWGPESHLHELGSRFGINVRDPHNLFLWLLAETGVIGAIPFFAGILLCFRAAWKSRFGPFGAMPLALMTAQVILNTKGTYLREKLFWIVIACALAAAARYRERSPSRAQRISVRRTGLSPVPPELSWHPEERLSRSAP